MTKRLKNALFLSTFVISAICDPIPILNATGLKFFEISTNPTEVLDVELGVTLSEADAQKDTSAIRPPGNLPEKCGSAPIGEYRFDGEATKPGSWPWVVLLYIEKGRAYEQHCGGVLISSRHVLTAAHCVTQLSSRHPEKYTIFNNRLFIVRAGEHDIYQVGENNGTVDISVRKVFVHPKYDPVTLRHDIALLLLPVTVEFSNTIQPICLPYGDFPKASEIVGGKVQVTGWSNGEYSEKLSSSLKKNDFTLISNKECQTAHSKMHISADMLCAHHKKDFADSCDQNNGWPLNYLYKGRYYITGVLTDSGMCVKHGGISSRVTSHLEWISEMLEKTSGDKPA